VAESFVQARWFRRGRLGAVRLIVIHCTVSPEMGAGAEAVARYFATTDRRGSAHKVVDSTSVVRCVRDEDTAFGAAGANHDGVHLELVGMPQQSFEEWLDDYGRAMFGMAGPTVREWMRKYGIPPTWLGVEQVRDGETKGFTDHATVERAFPSTGHWDPGPWFPRAQFMSTAAGGAAPGEEEDEDVYETPHSKARRVFLDYLGREPESPEAHNWAADLVEDGRIDELVAIAADSEDGKALLNARRAGAGLDPR
jgi:hypothetical protein